MALPSWLNISPSAGNGNTTVTASAPFNSSNLARQYTVPIRTLDGSQEQSVLFRQNGYFPFNYIVDASALISISSAVSFGFNIKDYNVELTDPYTFPTVSVAAGSTSSQRNGYYSNPSTTSAQWHFRLELRVSSRTIITQRWSLVVAVQDVTSSSSIGYSNVINVSGVGVYPVTMSFGNSNLEPSKLYRFSISYNG